MYYGKRTLILTCIATILAGSALHFMYQWMPNAFTALFSPVNESIWEHGKLIFWPYLAAALLLNWGRPGGVRPWLLVLPFLCAGMLILGYVYHILLGGESVVVDIGIYVAILALGFWIAPRFSGPFSGAKWLIPVVVTAILGLLFGTFTLWPPEHILFTDLSGAATWIQLPC
jgi:hypothetical protein